MRPRPRRCLGLVVSLLLLAVPSGVCEVWAEPSEADDSRDAAEPNPDEQPEPSEPKPVITERIEVTATRLRDKPDAEDRVPAHVTVVERQRIRGSGVLTLQDLLLESTGVIVYDQIGNDVQKLFDLRGFTTGRGTKIYLDGAPMNDPRNNTTALDLMPLDALERVELTRGSAAALAGGGSEAGVMHLSTGRGRGSLGGTLSLAGGTYDSGRLAGNLEGGAGRFDYFVSGTRYETDGFRENAGGDVSWFTGTLGIDLRQDRRLELSLLRSESDLGSPGSLTLGEFDQDPRQSANPDDFFDQRISQASLNYRGRLTGRFSASANLFYREQDGESFSRGRLGSEFSLQTAAPVYGTTIQVTHGTRAGSLDNDVSFGIEWLESHSHASGFIRFSPTDPGQPTANTATSRTAALFAQDRLSLSRRWSFLLGLRAEQNRVGLEEPATPSEARDFSEISARAGVNWNPSPRYGLYASYGEAFLPPTAEQLFAFPGFGRNPDLRPEDSRSYEIGFRARWKPTLRLDLAAFLIDTENEIVFIPDPLTFGGRNENFGRTRRSGIETSFRGRVSSKIELFANLTLLRAELRNGPDAGNQVPLVPEQRLAAGFDWELPAGFRLRADGLYVGEQVLANDEANRGPLLPDYTVVNARLLWSAASLATPGAARGLTIFVEALNLLDREYATRGILALNTQFLPEVFVTPAPDRRIMAGAEWRF